jgi:hypothetical protein
VPKFARVAVQKKDIAATMSHTQDLRTFAYIPPKAGPIAAALRMWLRSALRRPWVSTFFPICLILEAKLLARRCPGKERRWDRT